MKQEKIHSELALLTKQCLPHAKSLTVDQLRQLQKTSNNIVQSISEHIQQTTLPEIIQLVNRLEDFEEIFPEEISLLRFWVVGGENNSEKVDNLHKNGINTVIQLIHQIQAINWETVSRDKLGEVLSLAQEASYLLSFLTQFQEQVDRIQKFENFVKTLSLEDRKILAQMLKAKINTLPTYTS